jgi:hypothetical protein
MPALLTAALPLASAAQLVVRSNGAVLGNGAAEEAEGEAEVEAEEEAAAEAAVVAAAAEAAAGGAFHQWSASRIARRVSACVNCM